MRIPTKLPITAKRWLSSWWSIGIQTAVLVFHLVGLVMLVRHRADFENGRLPASMFQAPGMGPWMVVDQDFAKEQGVFLIASFGFAVLALLISIWSCLRFRRHLRNTGQALA
jgi:hypothetical protein